MPRATLIVDRAQGRNAQTAATIALGPVVGADIVPVKLWLPARDLARDPEDKLSSSLVLSRAGLDSLRGELEARLPAGTWTMTEGGRATMKTALAPYRRDARPESQR